MSYKQALGWGSKEHGLPKVNFEVVCPGNPEEAVSGECDITYTSPDAVTFRANGTAFVDLRRNALAAFLDPEDDSLTEWTAAALLEWIRESEISERKQRSRKAKPTPIKESEAKKMTKAQMEEKLREMGLLVSDEE